MIFKDGVPGPSLNHWRLRPPGVTAHSCPRFFAGTRYLKRGINDRGFVANHAETEQVRSSSQGAAPVFDLLGQHQ